MHMHSILPCRRCPNRWVAPTLAVMAAVAYASEAHMSGATVESLHERFFVLTMSTPSIAFEPHPDTGVSPEQAFHAEASAGFKAQLALMRGPLVAGLPGVVKALKQPVSLIPVDPKLPTINEYTRKGFLKGGNGPCCVQDFVPGAGSMELKLCFAALPSVDTLEKLKAALGVFFARELLPLLAVPQ